MDIAALLLILVTVFGVIVVCGLVEIRLQIEDLTKAVEEGLAQIAVEVSATTNKENKQ